MFALWCVWYGNLEGWAKKKKGIHKYVEMNHCASTSTITMLTLMHVWVKALGAEPGLHGYLG